MKIKFSKDGVYLLGESFIKRYEKYGVLTTKGLFIHRLALLYILDEERSGSKGEALVSSFISFEEALSRFKKYDKRILSKYLIYKDLIRRGYHVVDGYGRGIDLLVYNKGEYPNGVPSIRVIGVEEGDYIAIKDLIENLHFSMLNKKN
ncbi:MAG: hypothetical protein QXH96_01030, partial [Candidatus Geothermarchaeota archaeon]